MLEWIATAYGALDIREWHENESDIDLMLLGTVPTVPLGLRGEHAEFWRRLVAAPVSDLDLSEKERTLVREYAEAGLASSVLDHPSRVRQLGRPWLISPLHELVYSLVACVARDTGVAVVFIKGPALWKQGLRDRQHSGDVDVWCDPESITDLANAMKKWGWEVAPSLWGSTPSYHSITLSPGDWGSEVDIHRHMPGCAVSDRRGFETLLSSVEEMSFAGVLVNVPEAPAHAVVSALHSLRPQHYRPPSPGEQAKAAEVLKKGGEAALEFSNQIRATAVLAPALRCAFPGAAISFSYKEPLNWRWRTEPNPARRYLMALRLVPPAQRVKAALRWIWPEPNTALLSDKAHGGVARNANVARLKRILRGLSLGLRPGLSGRKGRDSEWSDSGPSQEV